MKSMRMFLIIFLFVFACAKCLAQDRKIDSQSIKCNSKEVTVCADTIIGFSQYSGLQQDTANLKKQVANLTSQLEKINIDKFLNIQDTTIFGSKFQILPLDSIPLRSRDFYSLIENIHDLNILLNSKSDGSDVERIRNLRLNVGKARQKITSINTFATDEKRKVFDFLSPVQRQYWQQLKTGYNEMNGILNSN